MRLYNNIPIGTKTEKHTIQLAMPTKFSNGVKFVNVPIGPVGQHLLSNVHLFT